MTRVNDITFQVVFTQVHTPSLHIRNCRDVFFFKWLAPKKVLGPISSRNHDQRSLSWETFDA